jgi:hypothetical protein
MARDPFADDTGIAEWLSWKRGTQAGTVSGPVTADGVIDARFCQGCGKRLSKMGIGRTRYKLHCSPACRKRAWRKRHGRPSYEGPGSLSFTALRPTGKTMLPVPGSTPA